MKALRFCGQVLGIGTLAAVLVACGGSSSSLGPSAALPLAQSRTGNVQPTTKKSWINPALKSQSLLYVTDNRLGNVLVYTYPNLTYAGELTGFSALAGECIDRAGNVFIAANESDIFEYAHGGASPIQVLSAPAETAGCAINRKTGDLAISDVNSGDHEIWIYHNATGTPTAYSDPNFAFTDFLGYDNQGNLFVDGYDASNLFHYAELPAGSSTFNDITLSQTPSGAGNVQWDGHYMAVGDLSGTIYQTEGATVVNTLTLSAACVYQFYILPGKHRIVAPNPCNDNADIYAYPAGGSPILAITGGLEHPIGAVLSK